MGGSSFLFFIAFLPFLLCRCRNPSADIQFSNRQHWDPIVGLGGLTQCVTMHWKNLPRSFPSPPLVFEFLIYCLFPRFQIVRLFSLLPLPPIFSFWLFHHLHSRSVFCLVRTPDNITVLDANPPLRALPTFFNPRPLSIIWLSTPDCESSCTKARGLISYLRYP